MRNWVSEWVQEGRLYAWRYAEPGRDWRGWHFAADPSGCRSMRNLLDRMRGGDACHRTVTLAPITDAILSVPNAGRKIEERFEKLRISHLPDFEDLSLSPEGGMLHMTVGNRRIQMLSAAFAAVETGDGDFDIRTSEDRKADRWMFWWMPDIDNRQGKKL